MLKMTMKIVRVLGRVVGVVGMGAASKAIGYKSMRAQLITLTSSTDDHTQSC